MVDALREAHRVLADGGILIDARPDSRADARVQRVRPEGRFQTIGSLGTRPDTATDDRLSDRAVASAKRARLFRGHGARIWWHRLPFATFPDLRAYLTGHLRLASRIDWTAQGRRAPRDGAYAIERPLQFELLRKIKSR